MIDLHLALLRCASELHGHHKTGSKIKLALTLFFPQDIAAASIAI
jgi:hypothetical protein